MRIAMVASEATPFVKTGGLADVAGSLSRELAKTEDVCCILPLYSVVNKKFGDKLERVHSMTVTMSWRKPHVDVYYLKQDNVNYYFIDNPQYFHRGQIYGEWDDGERFAFFVMAATEFIMEKDLKPEIVHVHDWHSGMMPCLVRETPYFQNYYKKTKFVLTIHNPAFQGMMDPFALGELFNLSGELYDNGSVRFMDRFSTLKAGIVYADKITTVSPTHRNELLHPATSMGLSDILRLREWDFAGILNGIDYTEFDPKNDKNIPHQYNAVNYFKQKQLNKEELFKEYGLKDNGKPLISLVSRVTWQKGMDLAFAAFEDLIQKGCNAVILGSGESRYEQAMQNLRNKYPEQVGIYIGYSDALAHKFYAASDFFLMPSLFEPCGLGQMIAQRYGTLPIVRRTGGLRDSVINYDGTNQDTSNGYGFDSFDPSECVRTCSYAYDNWFDLPLRKKLMKNSMLTDNSWKKSAKEYLDLYRSAR